MKILRWVGFPIRLPVVAIWWLFLAVVALAAIIFGPYDSGFFYDISDGFRTSANWLFGEN